MDSNISAATKTQPTNKPKSSRSCYVFFFVVLPVFSAFMLYRLDPSDPVAVPDHRHHPVAQPKVVDGRIIGSLERVGSGHVAGPEDLVYDPVARVMYTGCEDGWIKRFVPGGGSGFEDKRVAVEGVVNTGGRPLGLALSRSADGYDLIIADAFKISEYNGGALVAMVGKNCFAIVSDRRLGVQLQTVATDFQRIFQIHDRLFIGLSGLGTDTQTLYDMIPFSFNLD